MAFFCAILQSVLEAPFSFKGVFACGMEPSCKNNTVLYDFLDMPFGHDNLTRRVGQSPTGLIQTGLNKASAIVCVTYPRKKNREIGLLTTVE